MFANIQLQRRSLRSRSMATDVFEQASLSIVRRYQRAAGDAAALGREGGPSASSTRALQSDTAVVDSTVVERSRPG